MRSRHSPETFRLLLSILKKLSSQLSQLSRTLETMIIHQKLLSQPSQPLQNIIAHQQKYRHTSHNRHNHYKTWLPISEMKCHHNRHNHNKPWLPITNCCHSCHNHYETWLPINKNSVTTVTIVAIASMIFSKWRCLTSLSYATQDHLYRDDY